MVELSNKEKLMIAGTIILIVGAIAYSNVRIAETNKDFVTYMGPISNTFY